MTGTSAEKELLFLRLLSPHLFKKSESASVNNEIGLEQLVSLPQDFEKIRLLPVI